MCEDVCCAAVWLRHRVGMGLRCAGALCVGGGTEGREKPAPEGAERQRTEAR